MQFFRAALSSSFSLENIPSSTRTKQQTDEERKQLFLDVINDIPLFYLVFYLTFCLLIQLGLEM